MPYDKLEEALLCTIENTCKKYLDEIDVKSLAQLINKINLAKYKIVYT